MTHSRLGDRIAQCGEIGWLTERDRIDQMGPGPRAAQLDEVGALAVAEAVCPFGIHSDRARFRHASAAIASVAKLPGW